MSNLECLQLDESIQLSFNSIENSSGELNKICSNESHVFTCEIPIIIPILLIAN